MVRVLPTTVDGDALTAIRWTISMDPIESPYLPEEKGEEKVVSPTKNGTANGTEAHEARAPSESPNVAVWHQKRRPTTPQN